MRELKDPSHKKVRDKYFFSIVRIERLAEELKSLTECGFRG